MRSEETGKNKQTVLYKCAAQDRSSNKTIHHSSAVSPSSPSPAVDTPKLQEKRKMNYKSVEEDISDSAPPASDTDMSSKKKKKKKEQEGEEMHIVPADTVTETKKKKRKLCDESVNAETADQQVGETDSVLLGITSEKRKKKKKKRKHEQDEEEIQSVHEESVIEITGQPDRETDSGLSLDINNEKKKRRKKKKRHEQGGEEMHVVPEETVIESTDHHGGEADSGLSSGINSGKEKIKKKKRRKPEHEEEEMHAAEHQDNTETGSLISVGPQMSRADTISGGQSKKVEKHRVKRSPVGEKRVVHKKDGQRNTDADDVFDSELLDELQEFFPDVRKLSDSRISRLIRWDLPRFREFKKEGISLRKGRFSEEENLRLRKNITDFQALIGISSVEKVVFPDRFKDEEQEIRKLKLQHCYVEKIAEGIPRPCDQVSTRARKIFDEGNQLGRYSDEEFKTLIKLQNLYGNNWKLISEKMGRSIYSLQKRFSTCAPCHGAWTEDEVSRLKQALRDHLEDLLQQDPESSGLSRDQLCDNLPWKVISQKVETRHYTQCRLKWFSLLKTKLGSAGKGTFERGPQALQAKIQLINTLYNMGVDDQAEVDWHEVAKAVGNTTPVCIQKTLLRLKESKVPNWSRLSFGGIIDFLHSTVLPSLKENLVNVNEEDQQGEQRETMYKLSDIFSSEDGEEFEELDST